MLTKRQKEVLDFIKSSSDKKGYSPSLEEIQRYFKLASVSTAHFHISKLQESGYLEKIANQARAITIPDSQLLVQIPLLGVIAAGTPIEAVQEKETIAVPQSKIPPNGEVYALRVVGNSMIEENINDGDVVIIKKQQTAENGQKIVALIDGNEATLKKYYKEKGGIRLQPANKELSPIFIPNNHEFKIQGIVVDIVKSEPRNTTSTPPSVMSKEAEKERTHHPYIDDVIQGDCLEVMKSIPENSIDMILCDLPYGTTQNQWDSIIDLDILWKHYERIITANGVIALTGQGPFTARLILSNSKLFKYKIVWVKSKATNFLNAKKQPLRRHEDICIFYKQQPIYYPQMTPGEPFNKGFRKNQLTGSYGDFKTVEVKSDGDRYPTDVVYFKTAESEGEVFHPTQKPVELGRYLIRTFTKPGAVVLDNTCGSGSFLVSAVLEGRNFIGIEKNEETLLHKKHRVDYIDICKKRIEEARLQYKSTANKLF